jgi:hypothetical protein
VGLTVGAVVGGVVAVVLLLLLTWFHCYLYTLASWLASSRSSKDISLFRPDVVTDTTRRGHEESDTTTDPDAITIAALKRGHNRCLVARNQSA